MVYLLGRYEKEEIMNTDEYLSLLFDVYEAHYAYASERHKGQFSDSYAIFGHLAHKHFHPSLFVQNNGYKALTHRGKAIYNRMVNIGY